MCEAYVFYCFWPSAMWPLTVRMVNNRHGKYWFQLFFNQYITPKCTHRITLCVSFSLGRSLTYTQMPIPRTFFTIIYHIVGGEVKIMLPIKVIWLSFAHHQASIYNSSYICFECHWAVPRNSTLNPAGNVHDSFLLSAMLTTKTA